MRHKLRFPVESRNAVAQVVRERISQQFHLVQVACASRTAVDFLEQNEIGILVRQEGRNSGYGSADVASINESIRAAIIKEMVVGSRKKLCVVGNYLDGLTRGKRGSITVISTFLLSNREGMIVKKTRHQVASGEGSRQSDCDLVLNRCHRF